MDLVDIENHKMIVEKTNSLLIHLDGVDKDFLEAIKKRSKDKIDSFNNKNLLVCDISKTERGRFNATVKRIVLAKYYEPIKGSLKSDILSCTKCTLNFDCDDCIEKRGEMSFLYWEFSNACDNTIFSDYIRSKYALAKRKQKIKNTPDALEGAILEAIRIEILNTFLNKNSKLITKYQ
jgi:hypothetical protein